MSDDDSLEARAHRERMKALDAEQSAKIKERQHSRGLLLVHDGDGKGKSTAAFGTALRAAGHGQRVGLVQFIKGTWKTGEREALKRFPEIEHVIAGEGFTWKTQDRARDVAAAERGWAAAKRMIAAGAGAEVAEAVEGDAQRPYDLVILDELNIALGYGYLALPPVLEVLKSRPAELSVIVTGRGAPAELIALADTVTRMEPVKHAFEAGLRARKGVDF
ncbi:MAG: cob(I)yrinic acid a,c-diamide adenosyltransferase [Myxococcales bacterium]|nr:cob(I)yrinic acid a,c-diamide adenosyltransferase [Myxococcales bacterium]